MVKQQSERRNEMTTQERIDIATKAISKMTTDEVIASMTDGQWKRFEAAPKWMTARWFVISEIVCSTR